MSEEQILAAIRNETDSFRQGRPPSVKDWDASGRAPHFTTIMKRFGGWNAAIRAAGYEPLNLHGGHRPTRSVTSRHRPGR